MIVRPTIGVLRMTISIMEKLVHRILKYLPCVQKIVEEKEELSMQVCKLQKSEQDYKIQVDQLRAQIQKSFDLPQESQTYRFIQSILMENRLKYLPLAWGGLDYLDGFINLKFYVFDPHKSYRVGESEMRVNGQSHSFTAKEGGDYLCTELSIDSSKLDSTIIEVNYWLAPDDSIDQWKRTWYVPISPHAFHFPEPERLKRVIGDTSWTSYLVGGATQAMVFKLVLEKYFNLSLDQIDLLDWGCGCGRISQFLVHYGATRLVGADIDSDNLKWCSDNISKANFVSLSLYPPTEFADNSFDVVLGLSVMTHLSEETQHSWLKEVYRILKPKGIALLTVRGLAYHHFSGDLPEFVYQLELEGYINKCRDGALDDVIKDKEYYRDARYSRSYIRKVWGKYFNVLDILDGLVLQDVVVLQKPAVDLKI